MIQHEAIWERRYMETSVGYKNSVGLKVNLLGAEEQGVWLSARRTLTVAVDAKVDWKQDQALRTQDSIGNNYGNHCQNNPHFEFDLLHLQEYELEPKYVGCEEVRISLLQEIL